LKSALSTVDPYLQALAWDLKTRVAIADSDLQGARESLQQALAIADKFETLVAAWQVYGTAWQLYQRVKEYKTAETNREHAEKPASSKLPILSHPTNLFAQPSSPPLLSAGSCVKQS